MIKNYIKIAFRNLFRNRSYAFINIFGLAIGLACCILITLYVLHEWSYDKFHENYSELYRVVETTEVDGNVDTYASTYSALAPALFEEFPSIKAVTHIYPTSGLLSGPGNEKYQQDGIIYADSAFFEMFSFPLESGDPASVLDEPLTMVITQDAATRFFGNDNPIGKTLRFKDSRNTFDFEITGLAKNPPSNSHIQFDYVISYESLKSMRPWEYNVKYYPPMYTYAQLQSPEAVGQIESQFAGFTEKYYGPEYGDMSSFGLQPLADIHLYSNLQNELSANFEITYIYLFSAIAVFILVLACINFMNLATARSMKRAREVGMRKTVGASRGQLIGQFLGEAVLMTALGLVIAIVMVEAFIPYFNDFAGKELALDLFNSWLVGLMLLLAMVGVGLLAGSYPAFYLSSFKPIAILKGEQAREGSSTASFRKGLVVFQFIVSTILIFATLVISQQLNYLKNDRLGFDKEKVLLLQIRETTDQFNILSLKQEILRVQGVEHASGVSGLPGIQSGIHGFMAVPEENKADSSIIQTLTVDHDYVKTLGLNLVAGRDFSEDYGTDETEAFIINETAAKQLGWNEDPLNREITLNFYTTDLVRKKGKVIGVVEDFQYHSLHTSFEPVLIQVFTKTFYHDYLAVRLSTDNVQQVIAGIEEKWSAFNPERPLEYAFLDDTFDAMYRSETHLANVFNVFSLIAIAVACLGLFGLASYSTEQRIREIGIRKVLGAKISDILTLIGKDVTVLIVVSQVVALPLAYLLMNRWLAGYADSIEISIWLLAVCSVLVLIIAWATISYQSLRAATVNPVESLRSE